MPEREPAPTVTDERKRLNDMHSIKLIDEDICCSKRNVLTHYEVLIEKLKTRDDISLEIFNLTEELLEKR